MRKSCKLWLDVLGGQGFTHISFPWHLLGKLFDSRLPSHCFSLHHSMTPVLLPQPGPLPSYFPEGSPVYCKGSTFEERGFLWRLG